MTLPFVLFALLMVAGTLALILPPLLRGRVSGGERGALNVALFHSREVELVQEREEGSLTPEAFEQARMELSRELLDSAEGGAEPPATGVVPAWSVWGVALTLPLVATVLYASLGEPDLIAAAPPAPPPPPAAAAQTTPHSAAGSAEEMPLGDMNLLIDKLVARLQAQPDDPDGWVLLGRSLVMLERWSEAADAFSRARQLGGDTIDILLEEAQALAMTQGGTLVGAPLERVELARKLDPNNMDVIWFVGVAAMQQGDAASAAATWERLMTLLPPNIPERATVLEALNEARARIGQPPLVDEAAAAPVTSPPVASNGEGQVTLHVSLDPALAGQLDPQAELFVSARLPEGPKMPLAVVRLTAAQLPMTVVLDDSKGMMPGRGISTAQAVVVTARITRSGNPIAQSGDLEGQIEMQVGEEGSIVINRVVP